MSRERKKRNRPSWPKVRRHLAKLVVVVGVVFAIVTALAWYLPLPPRLAASPSPVIRWQDGTFAHVSLSGDDKWRIATPLHDVDPAYIEALLLREDKRFNHHFGVDPLAIIRAGIFNLKSGEVVSGASTLTMQLVRVLEPRPRTLASKIVEAFRAYQLELQLSKQDILVAYLTFIPFGRNVEGVQAAALSYFGHPASALDEAEISTLLAVPQSPTRRFPSRNNATRLSRARRKVASDLLRKGAFQLQKKQTTEDFLASVDKEKLPLRIHSFPRNIPHAAQKLHQQYRKNLDMRTTLRKDIQERVERSLALHQYRLREQGIYNGAAVVLDHEAHEVIALVGNFDFFDRENEGQIVAYDVPRSPGSTLKPLLYAQTIHDGSHLPEHWVQDVPVRFGNYAPRNYDDKFNGVVKLESALSRSLNVPFVNLLQEQGVGEFVERLRQLGAKHLSSSPGHYGLSAAIGALEVTPFELALFYSAISNDGVFVEPRLLLEVDPARDDDNSESGPDVSVLSKKRMEERVWSPGAAFLTRHALRLRDRPDFPSRRRLGGTPTGIFWKTGTSFGNHDAWSAGGRGRFTAVVWLGNLDRRPSSALVGANVAGPLLFDVLEALSGPERDDDITEDLIGIQVCAASGRLPSKHCPHQKLALAIGTKVPTKTCNVHRSIEVDAHTGRRLNASCRADRDVELRSITLLPTSVQRFFRGARQSLPRLAADCVEEQPGSAPKIVHPQQGQIALLVIGIPSSRQEIPLMATSDVASASLSWFVDGIFLGRSAPAKKLWWEPKKGTHRLVVIDESGRTASQKLEVRSMLSSSF
ncbi:MAG: penicillin-binding protein 1C [Deltaproteobacteria bacterium]|nr:penicillin-binding protein 1C [Deltaproteobacteria bacterium]